MAYNRDDEDKKNKGGSSSESGSSSSDQSSGGGSNPPSLRDNSYISVSRSGGIGTSTADAFNAARNTYNSALSSGMSRNQAWVYTTRGGYGGSSGGSSSAPGAGVGTGAGAFGSGYLTRGSTAYNQAQAQNSSEPTNWTQRREQSKAETFGIQGLQGVNNGQPDIRSDNWYSGASPTAVDIAARIYALDPNNKEAFDFMNQKRLTPGDETYSPYIVPTSRAVYALAELGVEQPAGGFTKEYCQQALAAAAQAGLLQFSDTSGNVKSPGKHASKDEKIAYHLAKLLDDMDRTDKAEIEWNSFKEDVMFKAGDTSRNMSDEEIWASIDWSKYPTLRQAEQDRLSQQPSEFTRALGIDFSYFRGMCWAARNNGGTGDSFSDAIFARLGEGNQWQYDEEKARRRDTKSDDFDPYGSGSTMQDAQLYYGTYDFNDDFWTEHQGDAYSSDSTKSNMFTSLYRADQFTKTANEQLEALKSDVDEWLSEPGGHTDEEIAEKLEDIYTDSDYNAIQKLNDSLMTGAVNTTGTIGNAESGTIGLYSRKRLEKYMRSKLAENATAPDPHDEVANTSGGLSGAIGGAIDTVGNFFTGLFRGREGERPANDDEVGVSLDDAIQEGTRQQQSRNTGSSSLPPLSDLVASGVARQTASATRSDSYPQFTPDGQPFIPPERTTAGPSRADFEKAKSNSDVAQQDRQNRRRNFAEGKYSLRGISTDTERQTFATAYPEFDEDVASIKDGIENGTMSAQDGYNYTIGAADRLAGDFYFHDTEVSNAFRALEDVIAQEEAQLAGLPDVAGATMPTNPATGQPMTEDELVAARMDAFQRGDSEQWEYLSKFGAAVQTEEDKRNLAARTAVEESLNQHKAEREAMRPQYDQSQERLKDVAAKYALADEMAALDGVDTGLGMRATDIMDTVAANFDTVKLPDWNAYDVYAAAEESGDYTQEEIATQAKKNVEDCEKNIAELDGLLDIIDRFQLNIPDKYLENIKETKRQAEANKKDGEYYLLRTNPDFAEKVAAGDSAEKWAKQKFHTGSSIGYALYAFKHKTADRSLYAQYPLMGQMSQAELDTAQYLLETQGPITADEYYLHLGDSQYGRLNTRYTEDLSSAAAAFGKKNAVGGTLLSVALSPLNSTGAFQIAFDKLTGRRSNPNSILSAGQKATGAMRQAAKNEMVTAFGGADSTSGKVVGFFYDAVTSAGDSTINAVLGLGPANMAFSAGTSSYNETIQNGGTETQALMMGTVSFLAEWATEKVEMTDIMEAISVGTQEAADGATKGVLNFFKNQLPELGNEVVGEAVGQALEGIGEDKIMGALGTRSQSIEAMTKALMDAGIPGMTEQLARSEATHQANLDFWKEVGMAGLMGGVSAGISTTGGYVAGNIGTTTERFLETYRLQKQYEDAGLDKAHARVLARIDLADINSNTSSYGPNRPSDTAETAQTETAEETATPVEQTAENANEANPQVSADLSTEAARDEQTAMNLDNTEQQTEPVQEPIPTARREQWEQRKQRRHQFASDLNGDSAQTSAQSRATSEQFSRRMFALESASTGSASQQVVTITGILDQDAVGSDDQTKAQAQAAAQNIVEQLGRKGCDVLQRLILKARTTNTDFGAVMQAVQVAALTDGESHQLLMGLDPRGISDENFNAFMQAANLEAADQAVRDTMHKRTYDVMIANEKARILSERGVKDLQTASERTSQTRRRRQHAQQQHEAKAQEVENVKQTLAQVNAEYDADTSGDMENAVRDAASDLPGAIEAERQLAQQLANSEAEEAAAVKAERDAVQAVDTEITQQAQQAVEERMRAVQETRERRADIVEAQRRAVMGNTGRTYVGANQPVQFHYALVPIGGLVTSNTDTGEVNPDYPGRLQPRDRTRLNSRVNIETMSRTLNPELLGANTSVTGGAPIVGPDFIVESGNQRTMAIRQAMAQGNSEGYTQWLRENAIDFGFSPEAVTDDSVLVRVRDTDVDRVEFARQANESVTTAMSSSETATVDADKLTADRLSLFQPNDNGDLNTRDNKDALRAYLQEVIPESEQGIYLQADGRFTQDFFKRVQNGLFQRAYGDSTITAAFSESTDKVIKNVLNAMMNVAPRIAQIADGIADGNFYDLNIAQNIVDAAKLIRDVRREGISVEERLNQASMFDDIDPTTAAIAQMFDSNKRSATKMTTALNDILTGIENLGAPNQTRLDGMELTEAPDKATFVQNSLNRTAGVAELESQGAVEGQTSMLEGVTSDVTSTDETASTTDTTVPSTEEAAPSTAPTTGATDEVQAYIRSDVDNLPAPVTQSFESLDVAPDVYFRGTEEQIAEAQAKEDQRKQEFRDIINNETFMALEYTLPDGRKQILHRSARDGVGFQLSYIGSDGIPTMHENYIRTGNTSVNEAIHSEEELLNHLVRENLRKPLSVTIQYAPDSETQAEGTIQASIIGAPNPTVQSQSTEPIKSGAQIIEELESAIGIPIDSRSRKYSRGLRKSTAGYTTRGKNIVHIQDADDVETAAHEIGHKVSDTFNLPNVAPTQKMVDFLMNHPDPKVRAWIKSYDPNLRANESIAEFCKYWMIDRNLAIQFAGEDFVNDWESKLALRGWLKPMQRASEDLRLNRAATNADRAVASIVMQTKENRDKYERGVLGFLTSFADYTLPLLDMEVARKEQQGTKIKGGIVAYEASSDPRTLMLARNGGSIINFANLCMEETMVDPTGNPVLRDDGTEWGSFRDIFKDIDINRGAVFGAIWELQNAKDRRNYGKDVFAKDIDIDAAYDQLARENPDLVEAYKKANAWMAKFIETWVVEPGMLGVNGKALWERMRKMYPNWAPAFRPTEQQSRLTSSTNYRSPTSGMMRADGSTSPVIDPVLGCAEYVKRYITNYRTAEALRGLINSASNIKGFEAVMEPAQFDLKSQRETTQNDVVTRRVLEALQELQESGSITEEGINKVEEVLNNLPDISFFAKRQDGTDVINVPMPDGSINSQTVYQPEILRAMTVAPASQRNRWIQAVGNIAQSLTGFLTANATARSIAFSEQNVFSDSETAMVTGHAAGNPLTFTFEWLKTAGYHLGQNIREARGQEVDQRMQLFKLFGAYGSRFSLKNEDDQVALRRKLFKSKSTLGEKVTLPLRAIEAITGFGEDTTRLMQFLSSYDKLIKAGVDEYDARLISGKIAHEASTDFKKSGMASDQISGIRKIIPFFNGQLQGVYKTVRMFSKENAGHRAQMVQRMVFSSLMTSLVASALREMLCDDKDKEEYDMLTAQERNKYHHIKIGDRWWRFKKSQDGIIQMADNVGEVLGNLLTGYEGDELGDLCSLSQSVASNMILSFDTVFDPVIDAWNGVTWSGQSTVDHELAGLSVTQQYNASTPWLCRALSNIPVLGKQIAPQGWEYILKQYTGSAGMLGSEMMSLFTEDVGSAENALYVFRNHFASKLSVDPVYSNALASTYKESKNNMTEAINDAKAGHAVAHFRPGLSQSQVDKGIKEARELTSSKGKLTKIGKEINDLWKKHESILKNTDMTKEDRAAMARDVRVQINSKYLQANEIMGDYWMKYGYRSKTAENIGNFLSTMFVEKKVPKYKK